MKRYFLISIIPFLFVGCNSKDESVDDSNGLVTKKVTSKQLNISILWDLSDRIEPSINPSSPEHYQRDIEIIRTFTEIFKKEMESKGSYKANGKLKVFFTPTPLDESINSIAQDLSIDLSSYKGEGANQQKKVIYDSITQKFTKNANTIYQLTLKNNGNKKEWDGSDIWRFFKNDVKSQCIEEDSIYRNILILITDGYIYHKDSREKVGNKTSFILPSILKPLRANKDWKDFFIKNNYGLIAKRNDLHNLEVLVLEINPSKDNKNDEDIIKEYFANWFTEMGIKKYYISNSSLPEYSKKIISDFMKSK